MNKLRKGDPPVELCLTEDLSFSSILKVFNRTRINLSIILERSGSKPEYLLFIEEGRKYRKKIRTEEKVKKLHDRRN